MRLKAEKPWIPISLTAFIGAMAIVLAVVPGLALRAWAFGIVVAGILARTLLPFIVVAMTTMKEKGEWPTFEAQFYVPLLGAIGLDLVTFLIYLGTTEGVITELSTLGVTMAFLIGYGGAQALRDVQKFVIAATTQPRKR